MLCATGDSVSCFLVLLFFYANRIGFILSIMTAWCLKIDFFKVKVLQKLRGTKTLL